MTECKHRWKYKEDKKYGSYYGVCRDCGIKKESWEIAHEEKLINMKHETKYHKIEDTDLNEIAEEAIRQVIKAEMPITALKITTIKKILGFTYRIDIKVEPAT